MRDYSRSIGCEIVTAAVEVFDIVGIARSGWDHHSKLYTSVRTVARLRNYATKAALLPNAVAGCLLQYKANARLRLHQSVAKSLRQLNANSLKIVGDFWLGFSKPSVLARDHFHDLARSVCLHCFINLELIPKTKTSSSSERFTGADFITKPTRG